MPAGGGFFFRRQPDFDQGGLKMTTEWIIYRYCLSACPLADLGRVRHGFSGGNDARK
jgi:hypothetical protein